MVSPRSLSENANQLFGATVFASPFDPFRSVLSTFNGSWFFFSHNANDIEKVKYSEINSRYTHGYPMPFVFESI